MQVKTVIDSYTQNIVGLYQRGFIQTIQQQIRLSSCGKRWKKFCKMAISCTIFLTPPIVRAKLYMARSEFGIPTMAYIYKAVHAQERIRYLEEIDETD